MYFLEYLQVIYKICWENLIFMLNLRSGKPNNNFHFYFLVNFHLFVVNSNCLFEHKIEIPVFVWLQ